MPNGDRVTRAGLFPGKLALHMVNDDTPQIESVDFSTWAPIVGRWETGEGIARYLGSDDPEDQALGMLIAPDQFAFGAGYASVKLRFPKHESELEPQARILFGFSPTRTHHYSAGMGGYRAMYSIEQFVPDEGWYPRATLGRADSIEFDRDYDVSVYVLGQTTLLEVNEVDVAGAALPAPMEGSQVGLVARGRGTVEFRDFAVDAQAPEAFVVMKFAEPYDTLYREVIKPVCEDLGYLAVRADEFSGPGVIIEEIIRGIENASVVIAEITSV
ncbi:hypothetical protein LCGC14_1836800, partial [marine sediment metagenome]